MPRRLNLETLGERLLQGSRPFPKRPKCHLSSVRVPRSPPLMSPPSKAIWARYPTAEKLLSFCRSHASSLINQSLEIYRPCPCIVSLQLPFMQLLYLFSVVQLLYLLRSTTLCGLGRAQNASMQLLYLLRSTTLCGLGRAHNASMQPPRRN